MKRRLSRNCEKLRGKAAPAVSTTSILVPPWNHAMEGLEYSGSLAGRGAIREALACRQLQLATCGLLHAISGLFAIDHFAVPEGAPVLQAARVSAEDLQGRRLSDHDAYTAEWTLT